MLYSIVLGNLDVIDSLLKYGLAPIYTEGAWNGTTERGGMLRGELPLMQIAHNTALEYGETHTILIEHVSRRAWIIGGSADLAELVTQKATGHWTSTKVKPIGNHIYIPAIETYCEVI